MSTAILPFNAGPDTPGQVARQSAAFIAEILRGATGQEIHAANYMAQIEEDGMQRYAIVNPSEDLNESEVVKQFFQDERLSRIVDGRYVETENGGTLTVRSFSQGATEPEFQEEYTFVKGGLIGAVRSAIEDLAKLLGGKLSDDLKSDKELFGTENSDAFRSFLMGFDAAQYIDHAQGRVSKEFSPQPAFESVISAIEAEPEWDQPLVALIQLASMVARAGIAPPDMVAQALHKGAELRPNDPRIHFAFGEMLSSIGQLSPAVDAYEKAARLQPEEPNILIKLAMAQASLGMPANAERSLKKAAELEPKGSYQALDLLSDVLSQTERVHEVPAIWKAKLDTDSDEAAVHAKYGMALVNAGDKQAGKDVFENAMNSLEDAAIIKRVYAPLLRSEKEFDRAMDFYEDCIDENPADVSLLLEYAETLAEADREFEIPQVLRDALSANPEPNLRAQILSWLVELEQPKRAETVQSASRKAEEGDLEGALKELKPVRTWLADYWKMWATLSAIQNRAGQHEQAEDSARQLLELFPACEPGYGELCMALSGQGKNEEAYQIMRMALGSMSNSLPIAVNFGLAAKRAGHHDEARQIARQIREAVGNDSGVEGALAEMEAQ